MKSLNYTPGMRVAFAPMSLLGAVIPTVWWNPGLEWSWLWRRTGILTKSPSEYIFLTAAWLAYMNHQHEIISVIPFLHGNPAYYVSSLNVLKQLSDKERFMEKPRELMTAVL